MINTYSYTSCLWRQVQYTLLQTVRFSKLSDSVMLMYLVYSGLYKHNEETFSSMSETLPCLTFNFQLQLLVLPKDLPENIRIIELLNLQPKFFLSMTMHTIKGVTDAGVAATLGSPRTFKAARNPPKRAKVQRYTKVYTFY